MKKFTKVVSLVLAFVLSMAMTVTAFADTNETGNYSITIKNDADGHTYEAYQILAGTLSEDGTTLSDISWGNGISADGQKALIASGKATDYAKSLESVTSQSAQADAAAAKIAEYLVAANAYTSGEYNATNSTYTISGLPSGYYLVKDKDNSLDDAEGDSYTLYIMEVVGNVQVNAKSDTVTVEKKIKDINDSTDEDYTDWQDSADYDIGDEIPYQLTGTLPDNYSKYDTYFYSFVDTLSVGLTYNEDVKVYAVNGTTETEIDADEYEVTVNEGENSSTVVRITFEDLKSVESATITKDTKIVARYTATLNEDAILGEAGNPNEVYLEFSNNPNGEGTGKTNKDIVIAFTYKVIVNKVDENNQPLAGAEFTLVKVNENGDVIKNYGVVKTQADTVFTFDGIDDGIYVLSETKTPDGYNTIDDITFTVTADHTIISDDPALESLSATDDANVIEFTVSETDGMIDGGLITDIVNQSGSILPSTGGAGRVAIYVIGAILVLGVGVVAVSKLRARQ
ncbi:MAG: isopeptide-forming domain-containing fimbrial protein [Lachnospiraceae bacterium]|nr:isopeptide-forming domain-containing fimbrial protein [Lachnospiraceae bacterium]